MSKTLPSAKRVIRERLAVLEQAGGPAAVEGAVLKLVAALGEAADPPEHGMVATTITHLARVGRLARLVAGQPAPSGRGSG